MGLLRRESLQQIWSGFTSWRKHNKSVAGLRKPKKSSCESLINPEAGLPRGESRFHQRRVACSDGIVYLAGKSPVENNSLIGWLSSQRKDLTNSVYCTSSGVLWRPRTRFLCGKRPNRLITYSKTKVYSTWELGTGQHSRDNVTMFSGKTIVDYCSLCTFFVATPLRHQQLKHFRIFLVSEALSRCRVVLKLKNGLVPSSGILFSNII